MNSQAMALAGSFAQQWPSARVLAILPSKNDQVRLRSILAETGWRVYCVASGRAALLSLWRTPAMAVICDCRLPDGTWQELLEETWNLQDPPALIVSGFAEDRPAVPVSSALACFVEKPFCTPELRNALAVAAAQYEQNRARAAGRTFGIQAAQRRPDLVRRTTLDVRPAARRRNGFSRILARALSRIS